MPFQIYPDFDCTLKRVKDSDRKNNASYPEKDEDHVPCCFSYKFVCIHDKFNKPIVRYRGKNAIYKFIYAILKEYNYYKNVMNEHFNKNLVMSVEDEKRFQSSNNVGYVINY